jgi:hypothetical protein
MNVCAVRTLRVNTSFCFFERCSRDLSSDSHEVVRYAQSRLRNTVLSLSVHYWRLHPGQLSKK